MHGLTALCLVLLAVSAAGSAIEPGPALCTRLRSPPGLLCRCSPGQAMELTIDTAPLFHDADAVTVSDCLAVELSFNAFFGSQLRRLTVQSTAMLDLNALLPQTLTHLTLSDIAHIRTFSDSVFRQQPNLTDLTLRNTSLSALPLHTFIDLSIRNLRLQNITVDHVEFATDLSSAAILDSVLIHNCTFSSAIPSNSFRFTAVGQISLQSNRFLGALSPNAITARSPRVYITNNTFTAPLSRHALSVHHLDQSGAFLQMRDNVFRSITADTVFFPEPVSGDYAVITSNIFPCAGPPQCSVETAWLLRDIARVTAPAFRCQALRANACNVTTGAVMPVICAMRQRRNGSGCETVNVAVTEELLDACAPSENDDCVVAAAAAGNGAVVILVIVGLLLARCRGSPV